MSDIARVLRSNLKLKHLQLLIALDEFRHLGRAADFLSLTQPAVSKSLAEIERMFELDLFTRSTRGTEPTPYGATVVRFARSVLADFSRTQDEIAAVASGAAGQVSVGAMVVATPGLLARAIQELKARSSRTTLYVEEGDLTRLLPRLRVGELDFIVGRLEPGYAAPDLETEALYEEPMCVVMPRGHALGRKRQVDWADLADLPWVLPPAWASSRTKLNQVFYQYGLNLPIDLVETASYLYTITFMQQLQALGFVAQEVAQDLEAKGLARRVAITIPFELPPVGLILMRGRLRSPASLQLIDCLRRQAPGMAQAKGSKARRKK